MKRGVKGQVTIFLIVVVLLIILSFTAFTLISKKNVKVDTQQLPDEVKPVESFTQECLFQLGKKASLEVGIKSGFIEVPAEILVNPNAYLEIMDGFEIPYWYYNHRSQVPTNDFIASEISNYIDSNLDSCLKDYEPFSDKFDVLPSDEREVLVEINDDDIQVVLSMETEVITKNSKTIIKEFSNSINVRMGRVLRLAREILNAENRENFLEVKTIDIMSTSKEVPFTNLMFQCNKLNWNVSVVKDEVKKLIYSDLPLIRIDNTNYLPYENPISDYDGSKNPPPIDMADYSMFYWDPLSEDFSDFKVGIEYQPSWPMNLVPHPSSGDLMKSESFRGQNTGKVNLMNYCIQFYHFTYDVEYPVKITISDPLSLDDGYQFTYAFPVVIRRNAGHRNSENIPDLNAEDTQDFCSLKTGEEYSILTRDGSKYTDLEGVDLSFDCIKFNCNLGKTDAENGRLITKIPENCKNGIIVASKEGYLQEAVQLNGQNSVLMNLLPLVEVNVNVLKFNNLTNLSTQLSPGEKAYLFMKDNTNEAYTVIEYGDETVNLVEGSYETEIYIYKDDEITGGFVGNIDIPFDIYSKSSITLYAFDLIDLDEEEIINTIKNNPIIKEPILS
jgi:hypothetical protein